MKRKSSPLLVMAVCAVVVLSGTIYAQEAGLSGTVTDSTDALMPGVTVTAVHAATGNTFLAVTDAEGRYRLPPLRPGDYKVTAELTGFSTIVYERIELLVGQQSVTNFKMTV